MQVLALQIIGIAGGVVDVPGAVEVVDLGGPDVAAAVGLVGGVDDLLLGRLEPFDRRRPRDLHVRPRRRHQVVVPVRVRDVRVAAARLADRVRERRRRRAG